VTFDDLEILACVYGPGSTAADIARMQAVGEGWVHGIDQWVQSGAPYLLLVGCNFGGASHSRPTVILAQDHDQAEQAIWAAMQHADSRLCLLETFEPSLRSFVDAVIEASRRPAGHA
jgi:hypothetical protein